MKNSQSLSDSTSPSPLLLVKSVRLVSVALPQISSATSASAHPRPADVPGGVARAGAGGDVAEAAAAGRDEAISLVSDVVVDHLLLSLGGSARGLTRGRAEVASAATASGVDLKGS